MRFGLIGPGRTDGRLRAPRRLLLSLAAFVVVASAPDVVAASESRFIRIDTDAEEGPRALQLSVKTYAGRGVSVDLVGAIHIADRQYYAALNEAFKDYDVLLFEMVAPSGIDIGRQVDNRSGLISNAQHSLAMLLDLSFQLEEIDYDQPNFVHADLTPAEFRQSMADRDESLYVYFWRIVYATIEQYARDPLGFSNLRLLSATSTPGNNAPLKTVMAYELTDFDAIQDIFGEDADSAIVGARNERAIEVLREQMTAGAGRVGIFYGVAHMPDLEDRLLNDVGLEYEKTTWVDAWQLRDTSVD